MARRGAGEGSIFKRKGGLWSGVVQVGVDENGRRLRRHVYGATRGEVQGEVDKLRQQVAAGTWADAKGMRVGEYLDLWLRSVEKRPRTIDYYQRSLRPVRAQLGGMKLSAVRGLHVEALMGKMREDGASDRARQMTFAVLHTALAAAVKKGLVPQNPAGAASKPKAQAPEIRALNIDEVKALLEAAETDRLEAFFVLALATGLRFGELAGLQWRDLDFQKAKLHVRRGLVELADGTRTLAAPKTSQAQRTVTLGSAAIVALRRHRAALGALPHPERLVFTSPDGEPMRRSNFHRRSWAPLLKRAKLRHVPFHCLRHTAASIALGRGASVKAVQMMLGHSKPTTTLNTYVHAMPSDSEAAAFAIDSVLSYSHGTAKQSEIGRSPEKAEADNTAFLLGSEKS